MLRWLTYPNPDKLHPNSLDPRPARLYNIIISSVDLICIWPRARKVKGQNVGLAHISVSSTSLVIDQEQGRPKYWDDPYFLFHQHPYSFTRSEEGQRAKFRDGQYSCISRFGQNLGHWSKVNSTGKMSRWPIFPIFASLGHFMSARSSTKINVNVCLHRILSASYTEPLVFICISVCQKSLTVNRSRGVLYIEAQGM